MNFASDNTAGVAPEILDAIRAADEGTARPYGADAVSMRLEARFAEVFEHEVAVLPVATGTAANCLGLAAVTPPWGAIYCHEDAHIATDECGAPEFYTAGAKLITLPGEHGKLAPELVAEKIQGKGVVHNVQPAALSITQETEAGTVYRAAEIAALSAFTRRHGIALHMDGARFANAVAALGCAPAAITWRAGVDVLAFGATKNGAMCAEAVVFFDRALVRDFELRRKRAGHLLSKSRFVAAQLLAYVESGLWQRNAQRTNRLAQSIGRAAGEQLLHPVESNEVFIGLGVTRRAALRAAGFEFYDWGAESAGEARFVVSWDQPEEDVAALCAALAGL